MGKVQKATRKFNKNHLKGELERRNKQKKAQQQFKKRELKKKRRSDVAEEESDSEGFTGIDEVDELAEFAESLPEGASEDMDMGKFMEADPENSDDDVSDEDDISAALHVSSDGEESDEGMEEGGDDDDDDDEESDDYEDGPAVEPNDDDDEDMDDEEAQFKQQLEAMKEKDPTFFKFMQENDPNSLRILEENSEDDGDGDGEEEEDSEMSEADEDTRKPAGTPVTVAMLQAWEKSIKKQQSIKHLKQLLLAFYSAAHMESENDDAQDTPYHIKGMNIFNKTVSTTIRVAPAAFSHYAPVVNDKVNKKTGKKWGLIQALVKSYLASLLELLKQMSDSAMIQYLIKESDRMLPYFACFTRFSRDLLKELLRQFGSATADDGVRVLALLSLRRLVSLCTSDIGDMAYKGIYLTYVRHSNVKNLASLTTIQMMRNCGVELYGNDASASYQHAFVYIRQLAIHLRNSMQLRSKESFRAIYNWQFINSLNFWTEVLATYCGDRAEEQPALCETLESLVYPLTQILLGVARLVPTAKYFPLRLHCISQLLRLSSATGIFIPILPLLIDVLESSEFLSRRPINSTLKPLFLEAHLKAPKEYEHTRIYLEAILESVFGYLADAFAAQSTRIAFPEWAVPAVLQLKRWRKRCGKSWSRFSKQLQGLLERIDQTSQMIQQRRNKVDFSPSDLTSANQFMQDIHPDTTPVGKYAVSLRKIRAQQRATLVEAEVDVED
ncbi:Nucleolar Complex 2 protein [Dipsacomyces acuminosporus]|nr:Nucleolar Complex 2 protein [Dipsacomyces acuminosporus]